MSQDFVNRRQAGTPTGGQIGIDVAVDTALTEFSRENLPSANVQASESNPNVERGPYSPDNSTSVGLSQQQHNWGTVTQRLDQSWSAAVFYGTFANWALPKPHRGGLVATAGRQSMGIAGAAQAVQGSAEPARYFDLVAGAQATVDYLSGTPCSAGVLTSTAGATSQEATAILAAERWISTPYVWGGGGPSGPTLELSGTGAQDQRPNLEDQPGFDCSRLVQCAYAQAEITLPRTSETRAALVQSLGGWTTNISQLVPGDLVLFAGSDGTI
ncbi:MAG: C40 family peptidase [Acidimicrobiales bacterium]